MKDPKLEITTFTVSSSFETYRNGEKSSHFVSMGVSVEAGASMDDFSLLQLNAAYRVSIAAIQDALMRGALTIPQANERIADIQSNHESIRSLLEKKRRQPENLT